MVELKKYYNNRNVLLFIAAIVNFPAGSAAIWSIFQPYAMKYFGIDIGIANMPFSVYMAMFVVGNIFAGYLQTKFSPALCIYLFSGIMCLGFLLTGFVPAYYPAFTLLTYGVLSGLGSGASYNVVLSTIIKWFGDKKGFASGIVVCAVGMNGFIMSPICNKLLLVWDFSKAMIIVAIIYAVVIGLGAWIIHLPDSKKNIRNDFDISLMNNCKPREMIKKKEFYFISGAMALGMAAYFTISPMTKTLGMQRGLSETEAVIIIMIIAISNCFGRLISTLVSDRIGCKKVLIALYLISTVSSFTLLNATNIIYMICVSFIAFCYGGFFGVFPIVSIEKFGNKYSGLNYGIIMIGYGIVSLICPYIVTIGVTFALFFATISCIIGAILIHRTLNK